MHGIAVAILSVRQMCVYCIFSWLLLVWLSVAAQLITWKGSSPK